MTSDGLSRISSNPRSETENKRPRVAISRFLEIATRKPLALAAAAQPTPSMTEGRCDQRRLYLLRGVPLAPRRIEASPLNPDRPFASGLRLPA